MNQKPQTPTGDSDQNASLELWQQVDHLRRRVRRLVWVDLISSLITAAVVWLAIAIAVDYFWRPAGWGGRFFLTTMVVLGFFGILAWLVWRRRGKQITTIAIARRLEAIEPALGDRLSSVVALLESDDREKLGLHESNPKEASRLLAQLAIRDVARDLTQVSPQDRVDRWPAIRSFALAVLMLGIVVLFSLWRPAGASLAAKRLFTPTVEAEWPRKNRLVLEGVPERTFLGETVEVFVRDTLGELPDDTVIEWLPSGRNGQVVTGPLRVSGSGAVSEWVAATDFVDVRARGGDDQSMAWKRIEVAAAPMITAYKLTLQPPGYLAGEPFEVAETEFTVLHGTELSINARLSMPVEKAWFMMSAGVNTNGKNGKRFDVLRSDDGLMLDVGPVALTETTELWFEWLDPAGLEGSSEKRWRAIVQQDAIPRVTLNKPERDLEVTLSGRLELFAEARDDLGLAEAWLEIQHVDSSTIGRVGVVPGDDGKTEAKTNWVGTVESLLTEISAQSPEPGGESLIEVVAVAIDSAGQRGQSTTRRLRIISPQAMRQSVDRKQSEAMRSLAEARVQQQIAAEQTEAAESQIGTEPEQQRAAADRVRTAQAAQQSTRRSLSESSASAVELLREANRMANENGLGDAQLDELVKAVEKIANGAVRESNEQLSDAAESLADQKPDTAKQQIQAANTAQQQALAELDRLAESMRQDDARRAANDSLSELAAAQQRLAKESRDSSQAPNSAAERNRLASRQRELARETEQLTDQLRELAESLRTEDATAADRAEQAAESLANSADGEAVSDSMRQAAEELQRGREGRAEALQSQIRDQLEQAQDELNGQSRGDQSQPSGDDPEAEQSQSFGVGVERVLTKQSEFVEQLRQPELADPKELAKTQQSVAELAAVISENSQAPPGFGDALGDAIRDMQTARALLERGTEIEVAVDSATAARDRLRFIVESLLAGEQPESEAAKSEAADAEQNEEQTPPEQEQGQEVPIETLKLVRATQEFLRQRTADLVAQQQKNDGDLNPAKSARLEAIKRQLAEEQSSLVQRIEAYLQKQ